MSICRKCKPFLLSGSQAVDFISRDLWIGPGFRLTSQDNDQKNLQKLE